MSAAELMTKRLNDALAAFTKRFSMPRPNIPQVANVRAVFDCQGFREYTVSGAPFASTAHRDTARPTSFRNPLAPLSRREGKQALL